MPFCGDVGEESLEAEEPSISSELPDLTIHFRGDSESEGGGGEQGGELDTDRQTRFGGSEKSGFGGDTWLDLPRHRRELASSDNTDLVGEYGGEFEEDLTSGEVSCRCLDCGFGGDCALVPPCHRPLDLDFSSSLPLSSSLGGESGGELDARLFWDLEFLLPVTIGLRMVVSTI